MTAGQIQNIVNAVLANLDDRKGFELISILQGDDPEGYHEMYESLCQSVYQAVEGREDPKQHPFFPKCLK